MAAMITATIQRIRSHLKRPDITKSGLARSAGLHPNTLRGAEADSWNPSAMTLIALERVLPDDDHAGAFALVDAVPSSGNETYVSGGTA